MPSNMNCTLPPLSNLPGPLVATVAVKVTDWP